MIQLSVNAACSYVRRAMDELTSIENIDMLPSSDDIDLHRLVEGAMVEAVVKTHSTAPAVLIDGITGKENEDYSTDPKDGVVTITMKKDTLRIASVQCEDSDVVVCEYIPEDSAEARKQLNKAIRGVSDDPRVVLAKVWNAEHRPILKYYSTTKEKPSFILEYIPYPEIVETIVNICPRLEYAVLNEITAMVLDSVDQREKAAHYRALSQSYMA